MIAKMKRKLQSEMRMLFITGGIVISIFALVFIIKTITPTLSSSPQAQAIVAAHITASAVNVLSGVENGYVKSELPEPVTVEVYKKHGRWYVKVVYDEKNGKSYEVPVLVEMEKTGPLKIKNVYVFKTVGNPVTIIGEQESSKIYFKNLVCGVDDRTLSYYISEASQKYNVNPNLIKAVIAQESSFKHCSVSSKNAVGYMQLTESLVKDINSRQTKLGRYCDITVDVNNPEDNILGGTCYLSYLIKKYGDVKIALTAYNCGPGNIDKLVKKYGASWDQVKERINEVCTQEAVTYAEGVMGFYADCYDPGGRCDVHKGRCRLC
ncbi:MAG: hypothetical protein DRP13_03570 [Candidatus Aenigmatarchaeota archaeon]|nr:MAG: hypothetical protein DRP13_03570 [Candidatus Aenigmarchaeota archaeon]